METSRTALGVPALDISALGSYFERGRISSKADAMQYAINLSSEYDKETNKMVINQEKVDTIYKLFINNMDLPDTPFDYDEIEKRLKGIIEFSIKKKNEGKEEELL